jgi:hypothetical protein
MIFAANIPERLIVFYPDITQIDNKSSNMHGRIAQTDISAGCNCRQLAGWRGNP